MIMASIKSQTKAVRRTWADPSERRVHDPLAVLAQSLLGSTVSDLSELQSACRDVLQAKAEARQALKAMDVKLRNFLLLLDQSREHLKWLNNGPSAFSLEDTARILCVSPERAREAVLAGVPYDLHMLAAGGVNYTCPACGAEH